MNYKTKHATSHNIGNENEQSNTALQVSIKCNKAVFNQIDKTVDITVIAQTIETYPIAEYMEAYFTSQRKRAEDANRLIEVAIRAIERELLVQLLADLVV